MFKLKTLRDKIALSGTIVLFIGVGLLLFTFFTAFGFLSESLNIIGYKDFAALFGEALAPLIAACIRIMYIGIMGWIGSILTIRGITILSNLPAAATKKVIVSPKPKQEAKAKAKEKEPEKKPAEGKSEPEAVVIVPQPVPTPQPSPSQQQSTSPQQQQQQ